MTLQSVSLSVASDKDRLPFYEILYQRDLSLNISRRDDYSKQIFDQYLSNNSLILAKVNEKIVGFCYYAKFLDNYPDNLDAYLQLIYVSNEFRGKGLSRLLLDKLVNEVRYKGYKNLFSSCDYDNLISLNMHKSFGFVECGYVNNIVKKGNKEVFLFYQL